MELFTRLISEGVFVFWDNPNKYDKFKLKLSIISKEKKYELFDITIPENYYCHSITNIGSGDYEIEIIAYSGDTLKETVTKKITVLSNTQQLSEIKDKIDSVISSVDSVDTSVSNIGYISEIDSMLSNIFSSIEPIDYVRWKDKVNSYYR